MNMIRFEFRRYLTSSFSWAVGLTFFGFVCIQLFVSFSSNVTFFETMLHAYSPEMLKAFGAELSSIKTLTGFYSFCFMYIVAAGAFQAMYLGMHVIGKEFSGKSADFLFSKPISRRNILTYKLIAVTLCILLVNVIYVVGAMLSANMTGLAFDASLFLMINGSMILTQFLFLSLGFLLGCVMKKIKTPLVFTTGIVCSFFLLQMVVNMEPDGFLSYFSFLNYVSADAILAHQGYEIGKLLLLVVLSVGFLTSGYVLFQRRDIHAV